MLSLQANAPAKIKIEGLQNETKSAWQQSSSQFTHIENPSPVFQCTVWVFYFLG